MPLWQLFTPENAYTPEEKAELASKITNIYSSDFSRENFGFELPRFYTSVVFHEIKADSFFVGGEPRDKFVQIEVVHIARTNEAAAELAGITVDEILGRYFEKVNELLKPYIADRGYEVEFHVETAPFETWQIDGMTPPPPYSEDELRWAKDNKSSPYAQYATT
jgi:phenylpyruvate tautomerase PptA (4-oxalocrotonate tautomerase family)